MQDKSSEKALKSALGRYNLLGLGVIALLVIGLGGWSLVTHISGAVIAPGLVVVETSTKRVQHSEGGIVHSIAVRDGDIVTAGELLVRLDDTIVRAGLEIVRTQLDELTGLAARLEAERASAASITWPERLTSRAAEPDIAAMIESQGDLLQRRRESLDGRRAQLGEQISQIEAQIEGLGVQRDAKAEEAAIVDDELGGLTKLQERGIITVQRVNQLQRERSRLRGEHGRLVSDIARARESISERRVQMLQIDDEFDAQVLEQLQQTRSEVGQFAEREIAEIDRLSRIDIRAPRAGVVYNLAIHTIGGVINAGETILEIVPQQDRLVIEVQVIPDDVDQIVTGQEAGVRFPGLDRRTTPELNAHVVSVSPDLLRDPNTLAAYYRARLQLDQGELEKLGSHTLVPGMPVESFIRTSERSVFSYLVKPMTDQITHAFRES